MEGGRAGREGRGRRGGKGGEKVGERRERKEGGRCGGESGTGERGKEGGMGSGEETGVEKESKRGNENRCSAKRTIVELHINYTTFLKRNAGMENAYNLVCRTCMFNGGRKGEGGRGEGEEDAMGEGR